MKISAYSTSTWCRFAYLSFHCSLENHFSKTDLYFDPQFAYSVIITLINIFDVEPNLILTLKPISQISFFSINGTIIRPTPGDYLCFLSFPHVPLNRVLTDVLQKCNLKSSTFLIYIHPIYLTHFAGTY